MDVSGEIAKMSTLWSEWELRALVLSSLFIQILLISTASMRTHTRYRKIAVLIWLCYLSADWVATFALGVLAKTVINHYDSGSQYQFGSESNHLKVFWAPFLLLHLGGPDNLTAFSLEDNELWLRHLLGFLLQVGTTLYVFFNSFLVLGHQVKLITTLMFIGGIIKYLERTLALKYASQDTFREIMANNPDPGPDYAKFMEEYSRQRDAERPTDLSLGDKQEQYLLPVIKAEKEDGRKMPKIVLITKAHYLFHFIFKRLVLDLLMTMQEAQACWSMLGEISWEETYEVIEIEIGILYDILYTKAGVIYQVAGVFFRYISISSITSASIIFFAFIEKQQYDRIDVTITYVLMSAAIALEFWSHTRSLFADRTVAWLVLLSYNRLAGFVFKVISYKGSPNQSRWSNSIGQYNLIKFCLKDYQLPLVWGKVMMLIHVKDFFDNNWYMTYENISEDLKEFIFKDLKSKLDHATDLKSYQNLRTSRGQLALEMINTDDEAVLYNSINKAEFDESILLWHIATDICYYLDGNGNGDGEEHLDEAVQRKQKISRDISNYMLYLLVSRPYMLTAGIGKIRFRDTCAEAKRFIQQKEMVVFDEEHACKILHEVDTQVPPEQVKGDKSKSVLFEAVRIAKSLLKQEIDVKMRWDVISLVWSEMLRYAANQCKGYYHSKALATGGELLTLVCYLMAHFGVVDQFRVIQGEVPQPTNQLDSRVLEGQTCHGIFNCTGLIPKLVSCLKFQTSSWYRFADSDSDKGDSVNHCRPTGADDRGGVLNSPPSVPIAASLHGDLDPANHVEAENVSPSWADRDAITSSPAIVTTPNMGRSTAVHFQEATFVDHAHLQDAAGFQTVDNMKNGMLQEADRLGNALGCLSIKVEHEIVPLERARHL